MTKGQAKTHAKPKPTDDTGEQVTRCVHQKWHKQRAQLTPQQRKGAGSRQKANHWQYT